MLSRLLSICSGTLLLIPLVCVITVWSKVPFYDSRQWILAAISVIPFAIMAGGVWGFRKWVRSSFAILVMSVLVAVVGVWGWWPLAFETLHGDDAFGAGLGALLTTGLQPLLVAAALIWAGVVSPEVHAGASATAD